MWPYKNITRDQFEVRKDFVEKLLKECGAIEICVKLRGNNVVSTLSMSNKTEVIWKQNRSIYKYDNRYYRISEYCPSSAPYIVIETAETLDQVMHNIMEDCEPFSPELPDERMLREVKFALGIEPYPRNYPKYLL